MITSGKLKKYVPFGIVIISLFFLIILLGPLEPLDNFITHTVGKLPSSVAPFMNFLSTISSTQGIVTIIMIWTLFHVFRRRKDRAIILMSSLIVVPIYCVVKFLVRRPRPDADLHVAFGFNGDSFPSGHSSAACAVFLTIAYLLYRRLPKPWSYVVLFVAVMLVILVGISRIYLHAHHPTDILGGWVVAGFGLLVVREVATYFESKRAKGTSK